MKKKVKNDCLTKTDVRKFFGDLGAGLLLAFIGATGMVGFVTILDAGFNWMEKPSKVEVLSDKVDSLKQQIRDDRENKAQFETTYWVDSTGDPIDRTTHEHGANH